MARLIIFSVLLWGIFSAFPALSAPISGDVQLDLVMKSPTCDVDEDGDLLADEDPLNGLDDDGDTLVDEDLCRKIDLGFLKVEMDIVLSVSISGLEITSTSVLTFK
ncbi:MAG: hypothetical protein RMJ96_08855, partial [Candidatus Bipolaricaulota bacterium]|nr:hypothetical protein [Candidatus Bipolaricaulota bacterium]